ncbi:hypothetical protein TNCV_1702061 [Trichonephila clavipes]|nr:hypothetical protein TNCV_1702061 [Trichonephila clavipes]
MRTPGKDERKDRLSMGTIHCGLWGNERADILAKKESSDLTYLRLCDTGQDMTAAHLDECSALNDLNCIVKRYWRSPLPNDLMVNGLAFVK